MKKLGIELPGAVDSSAPAVLDPANRIVVNGQYYWTSSAEHTKLFRIAPYAYSGTIQDPVSGKWFNPTATSPRRDSGEEILYFMSPANFDAFGEETATRK